MLRRILPCLVLALALCQTALAATLYIEEYQIAAPALMPAAQTPGLAKQTVTISGSSTQSAAFSSQTRMIRVYSDAAACVEIGGLSPTATSSSAPFNANQTEYFLVTPGDKLAVISCTP